REQFLPSLSNRIASGCRWGVRRHHNSVCRIERDRLLEVFGARGRGPLIIKVAKSLLNSFGIGRRSCDDKGEQNEPETTSKDISCFHTPDQNCLVTWRQWQSRCR